MSKLRERLSLTKKAEETYIYKFKSPIILNFFDKYSNIISYESLKDNYDLEQKVMDCVEDDMNELGPTGLTEYLDESLKSIVTSIIVTVGNCDAITLVEANKELTNEELKQLKEYIIGQFSDGWGGSFEQNSIAKLKYEDIV